MKFKGHASTNRPITTDTWWANITLKFTSQIQMKMSPCVSKWRFACLNSCSGWLYFYEVSRTCSTSNQFSLVKIDADMLMMLLFPYQSAVKLRPNITVYKSQITKMNQSSWWKCKILYCININKSANGHELQIEIKCCGWQTKAINVVPRRRKSFQDRRWTYAEKKAVWKKHRDYHLKYHQYAFDIWNCNRKSVMYAITEQLHPTCHSQSTTVSDG